MFFHWIHQHIIDLLCQTNEWSNDYNALILSRVVIWCFSKFHYTPCHLRNNLMGRPYITCMGERSQVTQAITAVRDGSQIGVLFSLIKLNGGINVMESASSTVQKKMCLVRSKSHGGCLNIRMPSYQYRDPNLDCLIVNMGISIPGEDGLYFETGLWSPFDATATTAFPPIFRNIAGIVTFHFKWWHNNQAPSGNVWTAQKWYHTFMHSV